MANPTKTSTAPLRMMIAMATTSIVESRFAICAIAGGSRAEALIWIMPFWSPYEVEAARGRMQ